MEFFYDFIRIEIDFFDKLSFLKFFLKYGILLNEVFGLEGVFV